MKIELLYAAGSDSGAAAARLRTILQAEGLPVEFSEIEVTDEEEARSLRFGGPPAIRVNGIDVEPVPGGALPSDETIRKALREARNHERHSGGGAAIAGLAAVGSVLAASTCCLPVLPFVIAASFAGVASFLSAARPFLLAVSILSVAFGFYQSRRARQCRRRPSAIGSVVLWASAVFVFFATFFPELMANAAADLLAR